MADSSPSGGEGLVPSQGRTQLQAAEAQRAGKKLLLRLLLGSLSKLSARQRRGDVLLAKASSSCASGSIFYVEQRIPTLEERGLSLPQRP